MDIEEQKEWERISGRKFVCKSFAGDGLYIPMSFMVYFVEKQSEKHNTRERDLLEILRRYQSSPILRLAMFVNKVLGGV